MDFQLPSVLSVLDVEVWFGVVDFGGTDRGLKRRELGRGIREGMGIGTVIYS